MQFEDRSRKDPDTGGPRKLQTEIWYPAGSEAATLPKNVYSEYLGRAREGWSPGEPRAFPRGPDFPPRLATYYTYTPTAHCHYHLLLTTWSM